MMLCACFVNWPGVVICDGIAGRMMREGKRGVGPNRSVSIAFQFPKKGVFRDFFERTTLPAAVVC